MFEVQGRGVNVLPPFPSSAYSYECCCSERVERKTITFVTTWAETAENREFHRTMHSCFADSKHACATRTMRSVAVVCSAIALTVALTSARPQQLSLALVPPAPALTNFAAPPPSPRNNAINQSVSTTGPNGSETSARRPDVRGKVERVETCLETERISNDPGLPDGNRRGQRSVPKQHRIVIFFSNMYKTTYRRTRKSEKVLLKLVMYEGKTNMTEPKSTLLFHNTFDVVFGKYSLLVSYNCEKTR